ncbi:MAG: glycosyltransferase family 4 protein [Chloroflexota bacterium]|nr:glycosyltransferase family 4 protein [Chloroflexota bacterium]
MLPVTPRPPVHRPHHPLRVLTWHVHGNYLLYLAQCGHEIVLPVGGEGGYAGRSPGFDWPDNVREVPAERIADERLDVVLFQNVQNWRRDQHVTLSWEQRALPRVYVEHDPPRRHPTDTQHPVDDLNVLLVHVTHFNRLMWDAGRTPTTVIEHGVLVPPGVHATHELERGVVVMNGMDWRGRRVGRDVFEALGADLPLDLIGMGSETIGGLGPISPDRLLPAMARYRFFFHPARYTSLGLAVLEAMSIGLPIVGLATTELPTVVDDGVTGFVSNDLDVLRDRMGLLLADRDLVTRMGDAARRTALERFGIERFARDWDRVLTAVVARA